jgi:copper chaperone CopZ
MSTRLSHIHNVDSSYLHALEGRLRIKIESVKGCPEMADDVETMLAAIDGIDGATANPSTGNVLVLYNPARLTHDEIIELLRDTGLVRERPPAGHPHRVRIEPQTLANAIVRSSVEYALQRLLTALIV